MSRINNIRQLTGRRVFARTSLACLALAACFMGGCRGGNNVSPDYDRPFPLGAVTDAHWETQQTNAEAADFVFHVHEFVRDTAELAPGAKRHIESVALRMEHVPFPILIEQSQYDASPELDRERRRTVIDALARMGIVDADKRVVIASAFAEGFTGVEGERAYIQSLGTSFQNGGGVGRRFGGRGASFR